MGFGGLGFGVLFLSYFFGLGLGVLGCWALGPEP